VIREEIGKLATHSICPTITTLEFLQRSAVIGAKGNSEK
jgi:hypothetical protein